jgi:hypothetical protein
MMSLNEVQTAEIVKRQIGYKWRAYTGVFTSLVIIQLLGVLFSLNGTGAMSSGRTGYDISISYFTADIVIGFTIFWGFITAFLLTTKAYREDDFAFITNRKSSTFSTIIYLFILCSIASITALLSSFLLKDVAFILLPGEEKLLLSGIESPGMWISGILATLLLVFMFSSMGYLAGMIIQWNKMFVILLPILLFGSMFLFSKGDYPIQVQFFTFIFEESSFPIFTVKTIAFSAIFYSLATLVSNQLEVRQ